MKIIERKMIFIKTIIKTFWKIKKPPKKIGGFNFCGEDGIRTREAVYPLAGLANRSFQPLTHLSGQLKLNIAIVKRDKSK